MDRASSGRTPYTAREETLKLPTQRTAATSWRKADGEHAMPLPDEMDSTVETFINWAEGNQWMVRRHRDEAGIPAAISSRYRNVPEEYLCFLRKAAFLGTSDETEWFNCASDFEGTSKLAFRWDEFERISLQAADADDVWQSTIRQFWDRNLPVFMSVKNDYAY